MDVSNHILAKVFIAIVDLIAAYNIHFFGFIEPY